MYLHLGQGHVVYKQDIIGIFALNQQSDKDDSSFLAGAEWGGQVTTIKGSPKSMVVTVKKVFICPLSTGTLEKRWVRQHLNL